MKYKGLFASWATSDGEKTEYFNSSVGVHVLISGKLSDLSSTRIISYMIIHHKYTLHFITKILQFTNVYLYGCTVENLHNISLGNLNTTSHIPGGQQTVRFVKFSNSQLKSITPLFILFLTG
jgi:hypothetical protein